MKALVAIAHNRFSYQEVPDPVPGPDDVLVQVEAVGICGTDLHSFKNGDPRKIFPAIWGHEPSGRIVGGARDGQRVAINPIQWCGTCRACLYGHQQLCQTRGVMSLGATRGAFAQLIAVPSRNAVEIGIDVTPYMAALAEPISVGHHGVVLGARSLQMPISEARCLVIGGGAIGLGSALSIRMQAARELVVVESNHARRRGIESSENITVVSPEDVSLLRRTGFDLVIDAVGAGITRQLALDLVVTGGTIVHLGLADENAGYIFREATLREIALLGAYGYRHNEFCEIVDAMSSGKLGALAWFETAPLEEGMAQLERLSAGGIETLRTLLIPEACG